MSIGFSQLLSIGGATTVAGGVVGGGYVAYKNRDVIIKTFSFDSNSNKPRLAQKTQPAIEPAEDVEDTLEVVVDAEPIITKKPEPTKPPLTETQVSSPIKTEPQQQPQIKTVVQVESVQSDALQQQEEQHQEDVLEVQPVEEPETTGSGSSVLDSGDPLYIIAKFTQTTTKDNNKKLKVSGTDPKNYICQYDKSTSQSYDNTTCKIFKLSSTTSKTESIEFPKDETTNEVTEMTDLTDGQNYLLRISPKFHQQFTTENQKIKLLEKGTSKYSFGDFSDFIEIDKGSQKLNKENIKSNLFTVFVTDIDQQFTGPVDYETDAYKCQLTGQTPVKCKFYKLSDTSGSYQKTDLDGVAKITNIANDLTKDKYILVEVVGEMQTTSQLQGKFQIYKLDNTNKAIVTGVAEELVIGKLRVLETPSTSNLFIPKDTFGVLSAETSSGTENAYIITKPILVNEYLKKGDSYASTDYICRVIAADKKHDDDSCKLFKYPPEPTKSHFDINDYKNGSTDITDFAYLAVDKHQVIVLKKALQDALKTTNSTLHLIRKDRKDKVLNNQVIQFEKVHDLTDEQSTESAPKTNLFLVRYKAPKTAVTAVTAKIATPKAKAADIDPNIDVTCKIGDAGTDTKCKIYKFSTSQRSNTLPKDAISKLKDQTNTSFLNDFHYVIELSGTKKDASELKNQPITIKQGQLDIGTFEFDSLIFGKPKVGGLQLKRDEVSFLVERTSKLPWKTKEDPTSYRCKIPANPDAEPSKADNFDFDCKLIAIKSGTSGQITTYSSIKTATEKAAASTLKDSHDKYYKLTFDQKLLYNFVSTTTTSITIEIIAGKNKHTKSVNVLGKITDATSASSPADTFTTSTNIGLFDVKKADEKDSSVATTETYSASQCSFSSDNSNKFNCKIYAVTPSTVSTSGAATSLSVSTAQVTNTSEFTINKLFVIDFTDKQVLTDLKNKSIIYYYSQKLEPTGDSVPSPTKWETWKTEFNFKVPMLGAVENNKQLFFVEDPTFTSQP